MSFSQDLTIKQTQKHTLAQKLIQSITILQLGSFELGTYIEEELLSNPLLEINEEIERERVYDSISHRDLLTKLVDKEDSKFEANIKAQWSLSDFLQMQFQLVPGTTKEQQQIGKYIIDSLDENGYRTERATLIGQKLGFSHDEVIDTIKIIQGLEPAGIAAKSLEESLILQLIRLGEYNEIFDKIINEHLEDLAANRIALIAKKCEIELDEAQEYCDIVRNLNPKPGRAYGKHDNAYIRPDCFLVKSGDDYIVYINEEDLLLLKLSPYYSKLKAEAQGDEETMAYLEERFNSAMSLINCIEQRKQTIKNVAEAIVKYQRDFFDQGNLFLKPMTFTDIASALGIHESTVSRTVNGKYIQTPRGLYELRFFFGGGTVTEKGEQMSSNQVRSLIKKIIADEDPKRPYSDEKIRDVLMEKYGIEIARRTIAKYRDQMGILGASKRRRY